MILIHHLQVTRKEQNKSDNVYFEIRRSTIKLVKTKKNDLHNGGG